jgi:hypothetical protein
MQGPARGYPLWTFLLHVLKHILKKKHFFEQGKVLDLVEVCFVFAFEKHAISIKNHSTTIKNTKEEGNQIQLEPERLFFIASANSNFKLQMQGPARGYPLWTVFLQFLKRMLIKNTAFLNKIKFWIW